MLAAKNGIDDVRRQYREPEEPRRIGRNDALRFGNILEGQASIREKAVADEVGTNEKAHQAGVGSSGLRPVVDDDPHLLSGALEASGNGQRYQLAIGLGLGLLDRLGLFGCFVKPLTDPILVQRDIDAVGMDLDAREACAQKPAEAFNPEAMIAHGKMPGSLDQPLLGYGFGSGVLNDLQDGGGFSQPVADATDDQRLKGDCRDPLAVAFGFARSVQQ